MTCQEEAITMSIQHEEIMKAEEWLEEMPSDLHIKYMISAFGNEEEITDEGLDHLVRKIKECQNLGIYLSQDPNLEGDHLHIEIDHNWIFLQYLEHDGTKDACFYSSFNSAYLDSEEESPMRCSDGQSIILKRYTMHDSKMAARCVEYFVRTGNLYSGMSWLKGWTDWE